MIESKKYSINEIFYSIQGEGRLAGTPMVFVRFSHCNLRCALTNAGFDCDTEFESGREMTCAEIDSTAIALCEQKGWILFTGGEPGLQLDQNLIKALKESGWKLAIETNGTIELPAGVDWICVSPKTAEHTLKQKIANEVKYIRRKGMEVPQSTVVADHYLISPAFDSSGRLNMEDLDWCIELVKKSREWALSVQYHKLISIR